MRNKTEIKRGLFEALKSTVNTIFWKRGFKDNFNEIKHSQKENVLHFQQTVFIYKKHLHL